MSAAIDPFKDAIASMLDVDAKVIIDRLRRDGYVGGITILKDHLQRVHPRFAAFGGEITRCLHLSHRRERQYNGTSRMASS